MHSKPNSTYLEQNLADLNAKVEQACDYETWLRCAQKIDSLTCGQWLQDSDSVHFDSALVRGRIDEMRSLLAEDDRDKIIFWLRSGLSRNFAGTNDPNLYSVAKTSTKVIIHEYRAALIDLFERVSNCSDDAIYDSLAFFAECKHALGKTALLLSMGISNGVSQAYHLGVVKALHELGLLPKIISGRSVGAIVVAIVCTRKGKELDHAFAQLSSEWAGAPAQDDKKDIDLQAFCDGSNTTWAALRRWLRTGFAADTEQLRAAVRRHVGDLTFLEAYSRTGLVANILVTPGSRHDHPRRRDPPN